MLVWGRELERKQNLIASCSIVDDKSQNELLILDFNASKNKNSAHDNRN